MRVWTMAVAALVGAALVSVAPMTASAAPPPNAGPLPVPRRTELSFRSSILGVHLGTANEHQSRPGLSIVKLYLVDYALRHGDGSPQDRMLAERMIRYSDDSAANAIAAKYPQAINAIAAEYHLTDTHAGTRWGTSYTSTADVTTFLQDKQTRDPQSPIFGWMATAGRVAADGTRQNWGTARLPGVEGTKWGWSDFGPPEVASASFGPWFCVAAQTLGTATTENADVAALPQLVLQALMPR